MCEADVMKGREKKAKRKGRGAGEEQEKGGMSIKTRG
jgi:hypothetical protein